MKKYFKCFCFKNNMKCDKCGNKIEFSFLEKFNGTYVGKGKNKKAICSDCQKALVDQKQSN